MDRPDEDWVFETYDQWKGDSPETLALGFLDRFAGYITAELRVWNAQNNAQEPLVIEEFLIGDKPYLTFSRYLALSVATGCTAHACWYTGGQSVYLVGQQHNLEVTKALWRILDDGLQEAAWSEWNRLYREKDPDYTRSAHYPAYFSVGVETLRKRMLIDVSRNAVNQRAPNAAEWTEGEFDRLYHKMLRAFPYGKVTYWKRVRSWKGYSISYIRSGKLAMNFLHWKDPESRAKYAQKFIDAGLREATQDESRPSDYALAPILD